MSRFSTIFEYATCSALGLSLIGLFYTPYNPMEQDFRNLAFSSASFSHWFGIDGLGRDFGSRLWRGAGNTVAMALIALSLNFTIASVLLFIEQSGPRLLRRIIPLGIGIWVAVPVILIGLVIMVFLKPSVGTLIIAVSLGNVPLAFRQLRILWIEQRNALYVLATEILGGGRRHLLAYTLWPNLRPDLLGLAKLILAICVLELSGLAFLGLIGDPDFPELGAILKQNQAYLFRNPMLVAWPGLILSTLLLLVHLSKSRSY